MSSFFLPRALAAEKLPLMHGSEYCRVTRRDAIHLERIGFSLYNTRAARFCCNLTCQCERLVPNNLWICQSKSLLRVQSKVPVSRSCTACFQPTCSTRALKFMPSGEWRVMPSNTVARRCVSLIFYSTAALITIFCMASWLIGTDAIRTASASTSASS